MKHPIQADLDVEKLGERKHPSPVQRRGLPFIKEDDRVLLSQDFKVLKPYVDAGETPPSFEQAGPRRHVYFEPSGLTAAIVTCGGLCPGLNDVIRSITMTLHYVYGVRRIIGFRYGYAGLSANPIQPPIMLDVESVGSVHEMGGTMLGSSRGNQDPVEMVDTLVSWNVKILFTIGGDGTQRGAHAIAQEIKRRNLKISVIGVPKTIDNDLQYIDRSFGFLTAVEEARPAILAAHAEAKGTHNGVGLVRLMGRHSGFIALRASLANPDVNFCLLPEVPFALHGEGGFLEVLAERLRRRHHAVIVVAEGAAQDILQDPENQERDKSGNVKLKDVGVFLRDEIKRYGFENGIDVGVKYIDPSYTIRSQRANSNDAAYCLILGQNAVHAGMMGRTDMVVGFTGGHFTHMPISLVSGSRKHVDPNGEEWKYLLQMTGQPANMMSTSSFNAL
jgi:6-phosphofructokinase 1